MDQTKGNAQAGWENSFNTQKKEKTILEQNAAIHYVLSNQMKHC